MARERKCHMNQLFASQVASGVRNDGHDQTRDSDKSRGQKIHVEGHTLFGVDRERGVPWFNVANAVCWTERRIAVRHAANGRTGR